MCACGFCLAAAMAAENGTDGAARETNGTAQPERVAPSPISLSNGYLWLRQLAGRVLHGHRKT